MDPRGCPLCTRPFLAATRGRMACEGEHVFTLGPSADTLVRIDNLSPDQADAMVEAAILVAHGGDGGDGGDDVMLATYEP